MHNKEETKLLPRYQPSDTPELQRLVMLGQRFGIVPAHLHTVNKEELGIPMPAGMAEDPILPFPTPSTGIKKITSSAAKMLGRLYAEYVYLCSFAPTGCRKRTSSRISSTVDSQTEDLSGIRK